MRSTDPTIRMFSSARYQARELGAAEVLRIQQFFEANPEYFLTVKGRPPSDHEAQAEFDDFPPAHIGFSKRWFAGLFAADGEMIGVAVIVADLVAAHVWHIALFVIARRLHRRGIGSEIFAALEAWARQSGARWLRLGVVADNNPAERFWRKHGFLEVRRRMGVETGGQLANVRVLIKPLTDATPADYLALVPRDAPDSNLP